MSASLTIDQSDFQATLRALARSTPQELSKFTNENLYHIAVVAQRHTPKADRGKIASELGATLKSTRTNKAGKLQRRYSYKPIPLVYAIVLSRAKGKPIKGGLDAAAKKLIAARLRAVGSSQSGWRAAIKALASAIGMPAAGTGPNVKMVSWARVARPGWSPRAEMIYRVSIEEGKARKIDERTVAAIERGFSERLSKMKDLLAARLRIAAKKAGAIK